MPKPIRLVCFEGPGDAIQSFRSWLDGGADNPGVTHVPFSRQLFDVCDQLGVPTLVLGEHPRIGTLKNGNFTVEHLGKMSDGKSGFTYHFLELVAGLILLFRALQFRGNVIVTGMRPHPFLMWLLRPFGVRVIFTLHNVLWPKFVAKRSLANRILDRLNGRYFSRDRNVILCVSADIKRQVRRLIRPNSTPTFIDFLPWFREDVFSDITPPEICAVPFRVLFIGRLEENKGIFDVLEIARRFKSNGRHDIAFDYCGSGSAEARLKEDVSRNNLDDTVTLHGWCDREKIGRILGLSHVVIVPTRTDFVEGFNMVVAETLLAHRPVISSEVCPALEYVEDAVMVVPPNDVDAYEETIVRFADDREFYQGVQFRAYDAGRRFLSEETSFSEALRYVLASIANGTPIESREIKPGKSTVQGVNIA